MPRILIDLTGQSFGQLIVEGESPGTARGRRWICRCTCGDRRPYIQGNLTHGRSLRCIECAHIVSAAKLRNHEKGDRLYSQWKSMRQRCNNPKNRQFDAWGGRGIRICDAWQDYPTYQAYVLQHLGPKPSPLHSIDRIDNNGNYEPGNIRWATYKQQANNRRPYREELRVRDASGRFSS